MVIDEVATPSERNGTCRRMSLLGFSSGAAAPWCGLAPAPAHWVRGLSGGGRGLGGLAALHENIPADAGEEEKRGDLAGLGHSGRIGTAWNAYLTRQQGWADDLAAEPRLHGLTGDD